MKKFAVPVVTLILLFGLAGQSFAGGETTLRITISPRSGPVGTVITVDGEGAQTDKDVRVSLVNSGETEGTPLTTATLTPNADGTFQTTLTIPDGTADGTYAVRASQVNPATGNETQYWWVSFVVGEGGAVDGALPETGAPQRPDYTLYYALGALVLFTLVGVTTYRWLRSE